MLGGDFIFVTSVAQEAVNKKVQHSLNDVSWTFYFLLLHLTILPFSCIYLYDVNEGSFNSMCSLSVN